MKSFLLPLVLWLIALPLVAQPGSIYSLSPYPKVAFERGGAFSLSTETELVVGSSDPVVERSVAWLQRLMAARLGDTLRRVSPSSASGRPALFIGLAGEPWLVSTVTKALPAGETLRGGEEYLLDVQSDRILLAGSNADGLFDGVSTLIQLMTPTSTGARVAGTHILDYPDYPIRWVFSMHNLRGVGAMRALTKIEDTMATHKLNGILQTDYKYFILDQQPDFYFDSVDRFKAMSLQRNIEIIPGVASVGYSNGHLTHDPNLAEGMPATAYYRVEGDSGRLLHDPRVSFPNGTFESVDANGSFTGWSFYDGPGQSVFVDRSVYHGGSTSARCTDFTAGNSAGNCRFNRQVSCRPYSYYHMSAWVKTESFAGTAQLLAIGRTATGRSRILTATMLPIPSTGGWRRVEVLFNSLEFDQLYLYAGVWSGTSGTIWWDDIMVEEAGLVNVLRRDGTPLHLIDRTRGIELREGVDVVPIVDSIMLRNGGFYPYHAPVRLRLTAGSAARQGDTIALSFFHAFSTNTLSAGEGDNMICVSEEKTYEILRDQLRAIDSIYSPRHFMLTHDEIRNMNHDSACLRRGLSPAELLADNVRRCVGLVDSIGSEARSFVWSDMFDSLHNAHDDYYLVNGDLSGVWNGIPTSLGIVNWNYGKRAESLRFFASHGFEQITAPYYDAGNPSTIRGWRLAMAKERDILGMLYTTWVADYSQLKAFGYYAWGAGPYIVHTPLDATTLSTIDAGDSIEVMATVLPDPHDASDRIDTVWVAVETRDGSSNYNARFPLLADSGNRFRGRAYLPRYAVQTGYFYTITSRNRQGLQRSTPSYQVGENIVNSVRGFDEIVTGVRIAPNPAAQETTIALYLTIGQWSLTVVDTKGEVVYRRSETSASEGYRSIALDVSTLPSGVYTCTLTTPHATTSEQLNVTK